MLKSYKYRLYPSIAQIDQIEQHFNACRLIWNLGLEVKKSAWESNKINVTRFMLCKQLTDLKHEYCWLYKINAQSMQAVIANLELAFDGFFHGKGYPKFKSKKGRQSFRCSQSIMALEGFIKIPKISKIKCKGATILKGEIRAITVSKTPTNKYFASVLIETNIPKPSKPIVTKEDAIGIDIGIKSFVVTSHGRSYDSNKFLKEELIRLKCLQRRASKKEKNSKNRKKAYLHVARFHEKIANRRKDYIHKITTELIRDKQVNTFVIEDLSIINMVKNRKLSLAISDAAFGEFFRQLQYKCDWYGKNLLKIGRFEPSSKTCSECQCLKEDLALSDREWTCVNCDTTHDRDLNAAKNIKRMGLEKYAREGISGEPVESRRLRRAKKQEKQ